MTDITTTWDVARGRGDWTLAGASLASGHDLATAILISLFTDARAAADDELPDSSGDRRGWWGDLDQTVPIGSKLWLLSRAKLTPRVATQAKQYAEAALAWLIDDGVASGVTVATTIVPPRTLQMVVTIIRGGSPQTLTFNWAWQDLL